MSKRSIGPGKLTINGVEVEASEVPAVNEEDAAEVKPEFFTPGITQTVLVQYPGRDGIGADIQILKKCSVCEEEKFCTDIIVSWPEEVRSYCETCEEDYYKVLDQLRLE